MSAIAMNAPARKGYGWRVYVYGGFAAWMALIIGAGMIYDAFKEAEPYTPEMAARDARTAKADAEAKAARDRVHAANMEGYQFRRNIAARLKDPESLKVTGMAWAPVSDTLCATYRARNSFNGVVTAGAILDRKTGAVTMSEHGGKFRSAWAAKCDGDKVDLIPFSL